MSECYEELVHSMMVGCSGNNTETLAMIRSYGVAPHYGFRLLSALQRTGELQLGKIVYEALVPFARSNLLISTPVILDRHQYILRCLPRSWSSFQLLAYETQPS